MLAPFSGLASCAVGTTGSLSPKRKNCSFDAVFELPCASEKLPATNCDADGVVRVARVGRRRRSRERVLEEARVVDRVDLDADAGERDAGGRGAGQRDLVVAVGDRRDVEPGAAVVRVLNLDVAERVERRDVDVLAGVRQRELGRRRRRRPGREAEAERVAEDR